MDGHDLLPHCGTAAPVSVPVSMAAPFGRRPDGTVRSTASLARLVAAARGDLVLVGSPEGSKGPASLISTLFRPEY